MAESGNWVKVYKHQIEKWGMFWDGKFGDIEVPFFAKVTN